MSAVADVLNGAADLIERDGWVHHTFTGSAGERCASRAIHDAAGRVDGLHFKDLSDAAHALVRRHTGYWFVSAFNDADGRTKAEVVAALRAAAERAS